MNFFPHTYFPLIYQQPCFENQSGQFPDALAFDENIKYLRILESQNQLLKEKVQILEEKLKNYEEQEKQSPNLSEKRKRAPKENITFQCLYPNCKRTYKSTLALNLHIKMKHNGGSIRQREAYAKLIFQCQRDNKPKPQININFPPNFLENYRKKLVQAENMMKQSST